MANQYFTNFLTGSQIQDRTGGTDILLYLIIQIAVILLTDGKNTGNTDAFSHRQAAEKFHFIRTGVITNNDQPVALHPDMDFNTLFFFSGILTSMQGIFKQIPQKSDQIDLPYL